MTDKPEQRLFCPECDGRGIATYVKQIRQVEDLRMYLGGKSSRMADAHLETEVAICRKCKGAGYA